MSHITTKNPYNHTTLENYTLLSREEMMSALQRADDSFNRWRHSDFDARADLMHKLSGLLKKQKQSLAELITLEMGKPIKEAIKEIEKCAWVCDYYAEHAEDFLKDRIISTDAHVSFIRHEPIGAVLAVMPWNYPFWQVFRFAAPALMAGNVGLLKHASNVTGCGLKIAELIQQAGFDKGCFQTLIIDHEQTAELIQQPKLKAVTVTGSEAAGRKIAAQAGQSLKKTVLELGGSNAFVVLADANLDSILDTAVTARFQNTGQSCIAAKRFIVEASVYDEFLRRFQDKVKELTYGDPMDKNTTLGPMARADLAEELADQLQRSVQQGAKILTGGEQSKTRFEPTIVTDVTVNMPLMQEETFGPVAPIFKANDDEHALNVAAANHFGLGVTICTRNPEAILKQLHRFPDGAVFINELVKSDPRLPFGGTGLSGYGRELSRAGIKEFINQKTVFVKTSQKLRNDNFMV
ncbi:NAD-dependent succinate-semialdehyde dehydrogenase [Marinicella gelatinilytica]|uniref:NAD-dependent succinate-semialdehyde dehydrogenase n=1 Tax=Marinicella gelatinilytica TaxID=2996017 RepID=UPI002260BC72|nr:NAD-dependent succinate-semialdehyde dehydrogenase [Marinicella gelatinilytica]MCX7544922.1 NAD-dependent succinate-semialdehyde dehydrogenase [Marinicella gelatinilytica]